jgi:cytochrome c oxidase cbb3-type subunit II
VNYGPIVFLAAFLALSGSWFGLVLKPQVQIGRLSQTNTIPAGVTYPVARPGLAREGLEVYRANGCGYCHSQQVGQTGTVCDVLLAEVGTNQPALLAELVKLKPGFSEAQAKDFIGGLPQKVLAGKTKEQADAASKALNAAGAKAQVWIVPVGPDIGRGWGLRRSVAEDFLFDSPVMLGSQRVGPDLANVGVRLADPNWHLQHLYAPQTLVKGSTMPPYRFLFKKQKIDRAPSPDALVLPAQIAPEPGFEVVPTERAKALAAYLVSLRSDTPLFSAPVTVAAAAIAPATNNPAGTAIGTNTPPANPPAR